MDAVTVCITAFKRPELLRRALQSVRDSGMERVLVFAMCPDLQMALVFDEFSEAKCYTLPVDLGCNELWLQAAYRADTEKVLILHDDDVLQPDLCHALTEELHALLPGFVSWRAHLLYESGNVVPTEYFTGPTRLLESDALKEVLLRRGRLSLSPIISIFDRKVLIGAVKEAGEVLPKLRKGMTLGTEVLVYLRHCAAFKYWLYIDRVLSLYGSHAGSGTVQAERSGNIKPLTRGYDVARDHFEKHPDGPVVQPPRILLVTAPFGSTDESELRRCTSARRTWEQHFNTGAILDFPCGPFGRSSIDIGDNRGIPYLRDLLDYGVSKAMPEDVVAYSNLDLSLTANAPQWIHSTIKDSGGVCCAWRRTVKSISGAPKATVRRMPKDGGIDLVAVTPAWWKAHRDKIPDMFVAGNFWDYCFRVYAERLTQGKCYMDDGTFHEAHPGMMERMGVNNPVQRHNLKLAKAFFKEHGMESVVKFLSQYDS